MDISTNTANPPVPKAADQSAVPSGYQRTEVGVIPVDWATRSLGEFASIRNHKVSPSDIAPDTLCVELEHIGQNNGRLLVKSTAGESKSIKYRFRQSDVLFGRLRSYLRKFWLANRNGICTTEIWPLAVDSQQALPAFLYALVQTKHFIEAASISYGTHMPRADWGVIRNLQVALPGLAEQQAIAEALSDVDGLIGALEKLIAKKRAIKQAAMQQLLTGKNRLPGFTGAWVNKSLASCGSTYGGITGKSKADFGHGAARYVTFLNVLENAVIQPSLFDNVDISPGESQNRVLRGDLLFNGTSETPGDLALGAYVEQEYDDLYLNSFCFGFRFHKNTDHDPLFFAYFFRGPTGRQIMSALAQGATRYNMSKRQFLNLECELPEGDEQREIAQILGDMDAEIAALEHRRDKTQQIKQGMMQQLLTGRVRLAGGEATA